MHISYLGIKFLDGVYSLWIPNFPARLVIRNLLGLSKDFIIFNDWGTAWGDITNQRGLDLFDGGVRRALILCDMQVRHVLVINFSETLMLI